MLALLVPGVGMGGSNVVGVVVASENKPRVTVATVKHP